MPPTGIFLDICLGPCKWTIIDDGPFVVCFVAGKMVFSSLFFQLLLCFPHLCRLIGGALLREGMMSILLILRCKSHLLLCFWDFQ